MDKKYYVRFGVLFIITLCILYAIIWGKTGILKYFQIKKDITAEKIAILELENKIKNLEENIKNFKKNSVELEKYARQDLQMGEKDEVVYLVDK
ncbi:septum formation initiator family protein [Candidatus Dependentiae bacterium]|nr:septum formation initiator family protein [Candidatus Dependentiae bacterium]MBU4387543.1 septum formation initiator family protein [Candidatus Dependentiae bacterium]MCG2756797.1 septum formation initiator family protein [Candidatus Dependentiae bacterium]